MHGGYQINSLLSGLKGALKGARYLLIIHQLLVAMGFFPAGVQDSCHNNDFNLTISIQ